MNSNKDLVARAHDIEQRNAKVSLDKQWEVSWTRKVAIIILTYIVVLIYLYVIGNSNPWINAIVPPTGFFLSTLAISRLRTIWQSKVKQ